MGWKSWIRWAFEKWEMQSNSGIFHVWVGQRVVPVVPLFRIWPEELLTWTHAHCTFFKPCLQDPASLYCQNCRQYTIYINIHQYTITVLAYYKLYPTILHFHPLGSVGQLRDFQVTTGTRIVEASTADGVSYTSLLGTDPKWVSWRFDISYIFPI